MFQLKHEVIFNEQKEVIHQISQNVWMAWQQKIGASYIIKIKDGAVLIDTTTDPNAKIVIEALSKINLNKKDVKLIFNTHYHFEQIGGNEAFPNARIYAHQEDVPYITGDKKGNNKFHLGRIFSPPYTKRLVNDLVDNTKLTFEDLCLFVYHTPGHTEGSTSYLYDNILFIGDLIIFNKKEKRLNFHGNTANIHKSIKRLLSLNFEILCLGDGHIFKDGKTVLQNLKITN